MAARRGWPVAARLAVAALLGLAVANPSLRLRAPPVDLVVLRDVSDSMTTDDGLEKQLHRRLADLPAGSRWALVSFGLEPVVARALAPVDTPTPGPGPGRRVDGSASRLDQALATALTLTRPDRPTALLLASDGGGADAGAAAWLTRARAAGLPVHWLPAVSADPSAPHIARLGTPMLASPGRPARIDITVAGQPPPGAAVSLRVDGRLIARTAEPLRAGEPLAFEARPNHSGVLPVRARLETAGGEVLDQVDELLHVTGSGTALVVGHPDSPVAGLLRQADLAVEQTTPEAAARILDDGAGYRLIVLDDVAEPDIDSALRVVLDTAVRQHATGLLVLGGRQSFGAGAYRHSELESLLPVISEGREPVPPAAVLFVVDTSGSMAAAGAGSSRLAMARRAVIATARGLGPDDPVGLLAFDIAPRVALPLAARADPAAAVEANWPTGATGGTRLMPALDRAVAILGAAAPIQRLLVLVTDGYVDETIEPSLIGRLRGHGIDVIAMPVGEDAPAGRLQPFTAINDGRLLPVTDIARLPRLMATEIAARRAVSVVTPGPTRIADDHSWVPGAGLQGAWPPVGGYLVTRPVPGASVLLNAASSDPLLAVIGRGAGLVAALPAGLATPWSDAWRQWPQLPVFLRELTGWLGGAPSADRLYARFDAVATPPRILVDIRTAEGRWDALAQPEITVTGPSGRADTLAPTQAAPGRYEASIPTDGTGIYVATVRNAGDTLTRGFAHHPGSETDDARRGRIQMTAWRASGLVLGSDSMRFSQPARALDTDTRPVLLAVALFVYLALLVAERRPALGQAWRPVRPHLMRAPS